MQGYCKGFAGKRKKKKKPFPLLMETQKGEEKKRTVVVNADSQLPPTF